MASSSISVKEVEADVTNVPNWLELPRDITANILQRLDTIDIVTNVCHVCPLWWNIFKDPLMWRAIRMKDIIIIDPDAVSIFPRFKSAYHGMNLQEIFRYAIERSCGNLEVIDIEEFDFVTDDLLQCIAKNARNLRCMWLVRCWGFSDDGFRKTVRKLQYLEELSVSLMFPSHDSLEVLAWSCPLLKSLRFHFVDPYHRLGDFANRDDEVSEVGWLAILDRCHHLESLDIHNYGNLHMSEILKKRFQEQIKDMRFPQSYWKIHDGLITK